MSKVSFLIQTMTVIEWAQFRNPSIQSCQFVRSGDRLMLHNVVSVIAIPVCLNLNCSVDFEVEHPWPYLSKTFYYAGVSKHLYNFHS